MNGNYLGQHQSYAAPGFTAMSSSTLRDESSLKSNGASSDIDGGELAHGILVLAVIVLSVAISHFKRQNKTD